MQRSDCFRHIIIKNFIIWPYDLKNAIYLRSRVFEFAFPNQPPIIGMNNFVCIHFRTMILWLSTAGIPLLKRKMNIEPEDVKWSFLQLDMTLLQVNINFSLALFTHKYVLKISMNLFNSCLVTDKDFTKHLQS